MSAPLARIRGGAHASVRHDSAVGHVTGKALYLDDMPVVPGTLEAALVLSPHAHARICSIDFSRALAAPGVAAAIAATDIPGRNDIAPIRSDEPLLPAEFVEYEGQPVAALAATTFDGARAAAKLADVDYEPLPAVLTLEEAIARELYVSPPQIMQRGNLESSFTQSTHRLSGELRCGGQDHFYLEGQIALAIPGDAGDMFVHSSTQHPTEVQHAVANLLGLPFSAVTCEVRRMGGAFGGKESQAT
ncbi:MAG TPA: molybdopterin cofactor-binding domain-containing protein, partial [Xanthobacteraceae bacterium]|nr:molybdopterin cofactor-binding domain-containing protein [Xanthobacteraceae bacterium]